jgi:hypothetical protein
MDKINELYAKTQNRIMFQEEVGEAVSEYSSCVVNCREPHPVK